MILFVHKKPLISFCFLVFAHSFLAIEAGSTQIEIVSPGPITVSLEIAWKSVLRSSEKRRSALLKSKEISLRSYLWFETAKNYYRVQFYEEALKKATETKTHFEQALVKAKSSYDKEDENVTQLIITKLKLGLAEIKNQVYEFSSKLDQAKVELGALTGKNFSNVIFKVENPLKATSFPYQSWKGFLDKNPNILDKKFNFVQSYNPNLFGDPKIGFEVRSRQAFIRVLEARKKMQTAHNVNKSVRTLMAMEASSYDIGLGSTLDLFDSFLINSRHINVNLESIYNFNMAVAKWRYITGLLP